MRTTRKLILVLGLVLAVGLAAMPPAALAAKDTLTVTASTSSGGFAPSSTGAPPEWFYVFCVQSTEGFGTLSQSFDVKFDLSGSNIGGPATISFNAAGSPAIRGTGDANLSGLSSFSLPENTDQTITISINTGLLAVGVYHLNVQISADPSMKIALSHKSIHIMVIVDPSCTPPTTTRCFLTDSSFNFLTDCSGTDVSESSGGTFQIVANSRRIVVATNPGQIYYNLIWPNNTGSDQNVTITLGASNLVPQGANAVHADVFDTSGFSESLTNWDMVNAAGTPCGPSGPCPITVKATETLWVTWHLAYAKIGSSLSSLRLSNVCSGTLLNDDGTVSASGTVQDVISGTPLATCTASAQGFLKK